MNSTARCAVALALAAVAGLALTSCGEGGDPVGPQATSQPAGHYPQTVVNCGRTVTYTQAPRRVVVGWPTTVDTLTALGVGSTVVGYTASSFGPPPEKVAPKALSTEYVPAAEAILDARPDFFLANGDTQLSGSRGGLTPEDLGAIGANAYVMGHNCENSPGEGTLDTVYRDVTTLGRIFDVQDRAGALNDELRGRVARAAAMRGDRKAPRIAYLNVSSGKLYALSGLSYSAQIEGVGGVNLFGDLKQSFSEISPERVLTLDADAIVFEYYPNTETADQQRAQITGRLANTRAVREGRVIGVPAHLSEGPGVAAVRAIELIATNLYN